MNRSRPNLLVTGLFVGTLIFLYAPLFYLVFQTFLENPQDLSSGFTLKWISKLFESGALWEPLINSIVIALLSATLATTVGTLGAIGLSENAKLPAWLSGLILLPILLPEIITSLSLLLFFLILRIPLGMTTVVLAHASFTASFVYFIMVEQLRKLDPLMIDAAEDLGAPPSEVFWQITLPNILPGMLGGWLLAFTMSFDDFLISFFTSGSGLTTLPLRIYSLMRIGVSSEVNGLSFLLILISSLLVVLLLSKEQSKKWVLKG